MRISCRVMDGVFQQSVSHHATHYSLLITLYSLLVADSYGAVPNRTLSGGMFRCSNRRMATRLKTGEAVYSAQGLMVGSGRSILTSSTNWGRPRARTPQS